jgi:hypothetical protein
MKLKEKYTNNESHFATRVVTFLAIVTLFIVHSVLFINPNGRSCLGPPSVLFFVFIGFPLIVTLSVLDLIVLAFLKKFNWEKFIINIVLLVIMFLFLVLFYGS